MNDKLHKLKEKVIELCENKDFIHNEWFVEFHLNIVEKIAIDLLENYKEANKDLVLVLVWMHDFGKIVNFKDQYNETIKSGGDFLRKFDFEEEFINKVIEYIAILDKKENLINAPIEVKIVSTSDGVSHFYAGFHSIFWKEFSHLSVKDLQEANRKKIKIDWEEKIVLPEFKNQVFAKRVENLLEGLTSLYKRFDI